MIRIRRSTILYIIGGFAIGAAIASLVILPAVLPGALGAMGFTATGVQLGSAAATTQSAIGLVSAGSTFALAQSVAMGGAIPIAWSLAAAAAGGAAGGILGLVVAWLTRFVAPYIARAMRWAQMGVSRAVERARRFVSWVKPSVSPYIASARRGAQTVVSRAVEGVRRVLSWVGWF